MFRVRIDYDGKQPIGDHWYGDNATPPLPHIGSTGARFYNVISLRCDSLPISMTAPVDRIFLPHYLTSNITVEDLYFRFGRDSIRLLNNLAADHIEVFHDYIDHSPRNVAFELLPDNENPASSTFDDEALRCPHHQLGGTPYFKQPGGHQLTCITCGEAMMFLLQFDCDERLNADFEDDGTVYYWWCEKCAVLGCRVESL